MANPSGPVVGGRRGARARVAAFLGGRTFSRIWLPVALATFAVFVTSATLLLAHAGPTSRRSLVAAVATNSGALSALLGLLFLLVVGRRREVRTRVAAFLASRTFFRIWLPVSVATFGVFVASLGLLVGHATAASSRGLLGVVATDAGELAALLGLFFLVARWGQLADRFFTTLTGLAAVSLLGVFVVAAVVLYETSASSITQYGLPFLWGNQWVPFPPTGVRPSFGAWPPIYGTLLTAALAMLFGIPLSIGIAMFLTELSPRVLRSPLAFLVELLAAIPSVVYGAWGLLVLVPYMQASVDPALSSTLGPLPVIGPLFESDTSGASGFNFLTAGIILAIMVIPTISAVTREAFSFVPNDQREAALSLGATRWETTRLAVIPYARRGMFGAITLGLGRAIGETIAVVLVIGNNFSVSTSLLAPGTTIASWIANDWGESFTIQRAALLELGLVLLAMSVLVNIGARFLVRGRALVVGAG